MNKSFLLTILKYHILIKTMDYNYLYSNKSKY